MIGLVSWGCDLVTSGGSLVIFWPGVVEVVFPGRVVDGTFCWGVVDMFFPDISWAAVVDTFFPGA